MAAGVDAPIHSGEKYRRGRKFGGTSDTVIIAADGVCSRSGTEQCEQVRRCKHGRHAQGHGRVIGQLFQ